VQQWAILMHRLCQIGANVEMLVEKEKS